jgi:hypothetical protein
MGVTLDVGHLLMAGENPAQSIAVAAQAGCLFGVQVRGQTDINQQPSLCPFLKALIML